MEWLAKKHPHEYRLEKDKWQTVVLFDLLYHAKKDQTSESTFKRQADEFFLKLVATIVDSWWEINQGRLAYTWIMTLKQPGISKPISEVLYIDMYNRHVDTVDGQ